MTFSSWAGSERAGRSVTPPGSNFCGSGRSGAAVVGFAPALIMFRMALETLLLKRRSIGPEVPLVEASEERANEQLAWRHHASSLGLPDSHGSPRA